MSPHLGTATVKHERCRACAARAEQDRQLIETLAKQIRTRHPVNPVPPDGAELDRRLLLALRDAIREPLKVPGDEDQGIRDPAPRDREEGDKSLDAVAFPGVHLGVERLRQFLHRSVERCCDFIGQSHGRPPRTLFADRTLRRSRKSGGGSDSVRPRSSIPRPTRGEGR